MAASIQEVLDGLNDLIPTLPPKVAEVLTGGEEVRKLADEVLIDFDQVKGKADTLFDQLKDALDQLDKENENQLQDIKAAIDDLVTAAVEPLETGLEAARKEVEQTVDSLKAQMDALQTKIEEELDEVKQGAETFKQGMEAVGDMIDTGKNKLTEALNEAKEETDALQDKINTAKDAINQQVNNLGSKMSDLTEEASSKVGEMMGAAKSAQEALGGGLEDIINNVIKSQVEEIVNEVTEKVSNELKALLDDAMGVVKDTLGGLAEKVFDSKDGQGGARDMLKPIFDQVDSFMDPIETALGAIKSAASLVGLDFD